MTATLTPPAGGSGPVPRVGLAGWRVPGTAEDSVRLAAWAGADGVQLDLGGPGRGEWLDTPARIRRIRALTGDTGAAVLAVAGNLLNDVGIPAVRGTAAARQVTDLIGRLLDVAAELGAPLAFVPSFRLSAIDGPVALQRTGEVLAWAAAEAQVRGLLLGNENVLSVTAARRLAGRVGSPAFCLVMDTFNPVTAGLAPQELVAGLGDLLADQVHLKDGPPAVGESPALGKGQGGLPATLNAMAGYRVPVRALVLENDYRDGGTNRLLADIGWARHQARQFIPDTPEAIR